MSENSNTKVGILTLYYKNYNFGGLLQAYALQKIVSDLGYECEQIQYDYRSNDSNNRNILKSNFVTRLLIHCKYKLFPSEKYTHSMLLKKRKKQFDDFMDMIPHSQKVYTSEDVNCLNDRFDVFICGGDQVWNNWGGAVWYDTKALEVFLLDFVKKGKKAFAYAPSLGSSSIEENIKEKFNVALSKLDGISIREESSVLELEKVTGRKVETVLDPVFLLPKKTWEECFKINHYKNHDAAICYFLGNNVKGHEKVQEFLRKTGLKTVTFPYVALGHVEEVDYFGDIQDFESGPIEFVKKIANAEIIFTDSFHAVAFSIIFHKNFYVFAREKSNAGMNNRITDLLRAFKLEDRLISFEDLNNFIVNDIDYSLVDTIIEEKQEISIAYLHRMLD